MTWKVCLRPVVLILLLNPAALAQQTADQLISNCKTNYQLISTSLKYSMKDAKDPASEKISQLEPNQFCQCYGNKNFEMIAKGTVSPDFATAATKNGAECAKTLLGLAQTPAVHTQPLRPPVSSGFQQFFKSDFQSGKGIGGLVINGPSANVAQILGQPDRSFKSGEWESLMYGPNLIDCTIRIQKGLIKSIQVGRTYQGKTDKGIRIGDTYENVKQKHGSELPLIDELKRTLLYEDGTLYQFKDTKTAELNSISVVTPAAFPMMETALQKKQK